MFRYENLSNIDFVSIDLKVTFIKKIVRNSIGKAFRPRVTIIFGEYTQWGARSWKRPRS